MSQTVSWERKTGIDQYGAPMFAAPATLMCRWRQQPLRLVTATGIQVVAADVVWCPPNTGIKAEDRLTLGDGRVVLLRDVQQAPDARGVMYAQRGYCY